MPFFLTLIVGAAVGFLATHFMGVKVNVLTSIAIGVLGAIVGGIALRVLIGLFIGASSVLSLFVGGLVGAIFLIWVYRRYFSK